jgi:hypothetical protein
MRTKCWTQLQNTLIAHSEIAFPILIALRTGHQAGNKLYGPLSEQPANYEGPPQPRASCLEVINCIS